MLPRIVLALSLASVLVGARAAGAPAPGPDPTCTRTDLSQVDMNACAFQAFQKQDHELNVTYARLVKAWGPEGAKQLQAAQRAWLQFRDLECIFESPDAEGSLGPLEVATCKTELTKERLQDFKRMRPAN